MLMGKIKSAFRKVGTSVNPQKSQKSQKRGS
jgi:hypothetical protein